MKRFIIYLFCCSLVTSCLAALDYKCGYDSIARKNEVKPLPVVKMAPKKGDGAAWQAHAVSTTPEWIPIRFVFSAEDIVSSKRFCSAKEVHRPTFRRPGQMVSCKARDLLTVEKKRTLRTILLPRAFRLHSDRLKVEPLDQNIVLPWFSSGYCATFTAPAIHFTTGVLNADMVLYVAAGPTSGMTAAWAGPCATLPNGRPVIGFANIGPHIIENTRKAIRTVAHEIGHAMGFDSVIMQQSNLTALLVIRNKTRCVLSANSTRKTAREQYACEIIDGMELEIKEDGSVGSHWERRNARDELMSPVVSDYGYYSALTMSYFDDTGHYKAIWGREERLPWAYRAGCPFLTEKCMVNNRTRYPDMFCSDTKHGYLCSADRRGIGRCNAGISPSSAPKGHADYDSFWEDENTDTEHCPVVQPFRNGRCHDGYGIKGNRFGPSSMCLKGHGLHINAYEPGDICAEVSCKNESVFVRYAIDDTWYPCPAGTKLTPVGLFTDGKVECPRHTDVCSLARQNDRQTSLPHRGSTETGEPDGDAKNTGNPDQPALPENSKTDSEENENDDNENGESHDDRENKDSTEPRASDEDADAFTFGDDENDGDDFDEDNPNLDTKKSVKKKQTSEIGHRTTFNKNGIPNGEKNKRPRSHTESAPILQNCWVPIIVLFAVFFISI